MRTNTIRKITESAILVAFGFVLSLIRIKFLPWGGAITCLSMLPILLVGYRHGLGWGLGAGLVTGVLQALQDGALAPPSTGLPEYAGMMALDYIFAFGVLGLSGLFRNRRNGIVCASIICILLRYACHTASGVILWGSYAWEGWPILPYSMVYNGSYMIPELLLTTAASWTMVKYLPGRNQSADQTNQK